MLIDELADIEYTDDLVSAISRRIRDGSLEPGARLPSIRALSRGVGLSPGSVARAMRALAARGLIVSAQGRRSTVAELALPPTAHRSSVPAGLVDLSSIEPDLELLPDVASHLSPELYVERMYDTTNVAPELEGPVRARFEEDGVRGELTVTSGALDALERILSARLRRGDTVLVEDPCWASQRALLQVLGLEALGVEVDDEGIVPSALAATLERRRASALILTPRGQNPTGCAVTERRAETLRHVLEGYPDLLVVEDDHLSGVASSPFFSLTPGRSAWAVIRSFSKSIGPDLRLAAAAMDPETTDRVQVRQLVGPGWVSHTLQRLVAKILTDPVARDRIARASAVYDERRALLLDSLASAGVRAHGVCGFTVQVPVASEADTVAALAARGWAVQAGEPYRLQSAPFVRVCVASLSASGIVDFSSDLVAVLRAPRRALRR